MEDNQTTTSATALLPELQPQPLSTPGSRARIWMFIAIGVVILAVIVGLLVLLLNQSSEITGRVRDVFIILMALESIVIGVALVILITQIAILINLLQNEIKPILQTTNETVNTLRGTTIFLSNNLVEPVIKLNEYLAAVKRLLDLIGLTRR
jgi:NADH:ubiquinone oxidoreductase subunit K